MSSLLEKEIDHQRIAADGWAAHSLGQLGVFLKGSGIRRDQAQSGNIPCVRYGEIYTTHHNIVRDFHSHISTKVSAEATRLHSGDLLFAGSGETKEDIGKCVAFVGHEEAYAGGDIIILRPKGVNSAFLGYLLNAPQVARQKASRGQGDAVVHISAAALGSIRLELPKIDEQERIATALNDIDDLIASLDALVAKKRDIKQAAMQQLLTGKTRLAGFGEEWKACPLGEVLRVQHGKDQKAVQCSNGCYPILATGGEIGRTDTPLYSKPSVLIGRKGTIDRPQYVDHPFWTIDTLFYTEVLGKNSPLFLFYVFQTIDWKSFNEASGVPSLSSKTIEGIVVNMPAPEEQIEIAALLTDFDQEIETIEERRAKVCAIKDGMMQQLLTGRIRLL